MISVSELSAWWSLERRYMDSSLADNWVSLRTVWIICIADQHMQRIPQADDGGKMQTSVQIDHWTAGESNLRA